MTTGFVLAPSGCPPCAKCTGVVNRQSSFVSRPSVGAGAAVAQSRRVVGAAPGSVRKGDVSMNAGLIAGVFGVALGLIPAMVIGKATSKKDVTDQPPAQMGAPPRVVTQDSTMEREFSQRVRARDPSAPTLVKLTSGMGVGSDLDEQFKKLEEDLMSRPVGAAPPGRDSMFANNIAWREAMLEQDPEFFSRLASGQTPEILWIGCSDSRVPANELLNLGPGEVFVHRNIANVCNHTDISFLSVLQYAVQYLKVKRIMVCGHYNCGGCKAGLGSDRLGLIDNWLRHIRDVRRNNAKALSECKSKDEELNRLIELNVLESVHSVVSTTIVQDAWDAGQELIVQGVVYQVANGKLSDIGVVANSLDDVPPVYRTLSPTSKVSEVIADTPILALSEGRLTNQFAAMYDKIYSQKAGDLAAGTDKYFQMNEQWRKAMIAKDKDYFMKNATSQAPEILWIGCSDSRVPANQLLDMPPGAVFVHRNIANMAIHSDMSFLSVLQYAVEYLKVKKVVVCGHYNCGGCNASLGDARLGLIDNWLRHVRDVRRWHQAELSQCKDAEEELSRLIELNVLEQVHNVCSTSIIQEAWDRGQNVEVQGVVYGVGDGILRDMGVVANKSDDISKLYRSKALV
ncbi:Carbonic anhydrase 2 [Porphyridium purpureum]|uniref:Carbonic anhydrase n=1 Tax=Porphyridium purpureum TaxID=35688 RepID=A0A5J4YZB0_PORPP|nr:Carbonic anhydrase 2 [Porphyridium purpureum]|eukprot:POR8354..scf208_2